MNKIFVFTTFILILCSCIGKHNSVAQKVSISEEIKLPEKREIGDTILVDLFKSNIYWKGTKMRGLGKHEGEIDLKNGYFIIKNKQLVSGAFAVDMTSISVTDIPEHEPVPRKNLNTHLKSADFFDVQKFPTSEFQITNVKEITTDSLMISGNLTLKNITKHIEFGAKYQNKSFITKFTFDRFQWNIAYKGNLVDKTLVDKDIEIKIAIQLK